MQHPVMGAPETKLQQHLVGIADEITVSEKQQLNDVPNGLAGRPARRTAFCQPCASDNRFAHIYVSHIDIFCFYVTKTASETKGSYQKGPFLNKHARALEGVLPVGQVIPGVTG
jgi:hypothetical protein